MIANLDLLFSLLLLVSEECIIDFLETKYVLSLKKWTNLIVNQPTCFLEIRYRLRSPVTLLIQRQHIAVERGDLALIREIHGELQRADQYWRDVSRKYSLPGLEPLENRVTRTRLNILLSTPFYLLTSISVAAIRESGSGGSYLNTIFKLLFNICSSYTRIQVEMMD